MARIVGTNLEQVIKYLKYNFAGDIIKTKIKELINAVQEVPQIFQELDKSTPLKDYLLPYPDKHWLILEVMFKDVDSDLLHQMLEASEFKAFLWAAEGGHIEVVKFLLATARNLEASGETGIVNQMLGARAFGALHRAIREGQIEVVIFIIETIIQYTTFKEEDLFSEPNNRGIKKQYDFILNILQDNIETNELIVTVNSRNQVDINQIKKIAARIAEIEEIKNVKFITHIELYEKLKKQQKSISKIFSKTAKIFTDNTCEYQYHKILSESDTIENKIVLRKTYKTGFVAEVEFDFNGKNKDSVKDLRFKSETAAKELDSQNEKIYKNFKKQNLDIARVKNSVTNQLLGIFTPCSEDIFKNIIEMWLPNTRDELLKFDLKKIYPKLKAA